MNILQKGNSKVWALVAGLVAVALVVLYLGGSFPPSAEESAGTIVPAERYRDENALSSDDVDLGDQTIATFVQTDAFEVLANNPGVAEALNSQAFRDALASSDFRDALNSSDFRDALNKNTEILVEMTTMIRERLVR